MAAFDPATLDRWRSLAIVDRDGVTVGTINEFYLDRETGHPTWALVDTGLFGTTKTFVPLVHATEVDDGLQVPYDKNHIKDAPQVDPHDELTPDEEANLFAHYGVEYQPWTDPGMEAAEGAPPIPTDPGAAGSAEPDLPGAAAAGSGDAVPPASGPTDATTSDPPASAATRATSTDPRGTEESGSTSADPPGTEPPGPVRAAPGPTDEPGAVPDEPGSIDGSEPEPDSAPAPGGPRPEQRGEVAGEPGTAGPEDITRVGPDSSWPEPGRGGDKSAEAGSDPSRPVAVEPGLPGSTVTTTEPTPTTVERPVAGPLDHSAPEPQAPDEPGRAPGAAGSLDEPEPVSPPPGASDRWREAKLTAERERSARTEATHHEDRSPLERARRRLERLVGGGQTHADADDRTDREAAERARRSRLGLDEDDHRDR